MPCVQGTQRAIIRNAHQAARSIVDRLLQANMGQIRPFRRHMDRFRMGKGKDNDLIRELADIKQEEEIGQKDLDELDTETYTTYPTRRHRENS